MTGELLGHSVTRRHMLLSATAIAATALTAACGRNVPVTPAPTAIPAAGTRLASNLATTTVPTEAAAPSTPAVPTVGRTLATVTGSPTKPLIIFAGGGITAGTGVADIEAYPSQTMALLGPAKYDAVNLGILGGQTISLKDTLAPSTIDPLFAASRSKNIVVLVAGSEDLVTGTSAAETFARAITFCQARRQVGFTVVISTILPRTGSLRAMPPGDYEITRQDYNVRVRTNLTSFADALADIGADPTIGMVGALANTTYYQGDGVNPTAKGHRIMAGIVKTAILTL